MHPIFLCYLVFVALAQLAACSGGGSDGNTSTGNQSDTYTENTVTLSELVAGNLVQNKVTAPTNCTYISDIYSSNGTCISPTNVLGFAEQVRLDSNRD